MIGFGMQDYPSYAVYLHLPPGLLNELVEKYSLYDSHEGSPYIPIDFSQN
jgi:hypothetical protein